MDNPVIDYYMEAIDRGYLVREESADGCWERLVCRRRFQQPRHGYMAQWEVGEPVIESHRQTEYGEAKGEEEYKYLLAELRADLNKV